MSEEAEEDRNFEEQDENEISQEDVWVVISEFFEEHGLVSQQLASFNHFIKSTVQEIVDEYSTIELIPERQYLPGEQRKVRQELKYSISFGQFYVHVIPTHKE